MIEVKKKVLGNDDLKSKVYAKFKEKRKDKGISAIYRLNAIEMEQGRKVDAPDPYASDVPIT
tara:strand:- start:2233 stop:2418 length:186 start_codon:yes stop_codon:yes gene_type:complete